MNPSRLGSRLRKLLVALTLCATHPSRGNAQDSVLTKVGRPRESGITLSEQAPQRVEAAQGVRARVLAVDAFGRPTWLEGIVIEANRRSVRIGCMIGSRADSLRSAVTPAGRRFACDSASREILWSQVEEFHVRRMQTASTLASLGNGALGIVEGGLVGALVGGGATLLVQWGWTSIEKADGPTDPRVYWPDARRIAIGLGAASAIAGGNSGWQWSRGDWKEMPLPGDPDEIIVPVTPP